MCSFVTPCYELYCCEFITYSFCELSQGEEIAIGIRGFTHGYDFYAPRDSVVFHEYASMSSRRKKIPMFWYVMCILLCTASDGFHSGPRRLWRTLRRLSISAQNTLYIVSFCYVYVPVIEYYQFVCCYCTGKTRATEE